MDAEINCLLKDWISRLPDDILVNIISRLTAKEAGRTSVLAGRWKYLWTLRTALIFDVSKDLSNLEEGMDIGPKYVSWVSKVLELHRGSYINEFRVCFALRGSHESDIIASSITNWISTVIEKGVQELELNFNRSTSELYIISDDLYTFPRECYNSLKTPNGLSSIKSLRSLCLDGVNVTGEILEFFIYNCPLERLHVANSKNLRSLKNVPRLVEFSIDRDIVFAGPNMSLNPDELEPLNLSFLPQLETLAMGLRLDIEESIHFPLCDLSNLKHLTLDVRVLGTGSYLNLISVIKACPILQKFALQLVHVDRTRRGECCPFPKCSHQHLKVVELIGFIGDPLDIEFAFYFIGNANMLEKMIVEPRSDSIACNYSIYKDVIEQIVGESLSKFHYTQFKAMLEEMIAEPVSEYKSVLEEMAAERMSEYYQYGPIQRAEMLKTKASILAGFFVRDQCFAIRCFLFIWLC